MHVFPLPELSHAMLTLHCTIVSVLYKPNTRRHSIQITPRQIFRVFSRPNFRKLLYIIRKIFASQSFFSFRCTLGFLDNLTSLLKKNAFFFQPKRTNQLLQAVNRKSKKSFDPPIIRNFLQKNEVPFIN